MGSSLTKYVGSSIKETIIGEDKAENEKKKKVQKENKQTVDAVNEVSNTLIDDTLELYDDMVKSYTNYMYNIKKDSSKRNIDEIRRKYNIDK